MKVDIKLAVIMFLIQNTRSYDSWSSAYPEYIAKKLKLDLELVRKACKALTNLEFLHEFTAGDGGNSYSLNEYIDRNILEHLEDYEIVELPIYIPMLPFADIWDNPEEDEAWKHLLDLPSID